MSKKRIFFSIIGSIVGIFALFVAVATYKSTQAPDPEDTYISNSPLPSKPGALISSAVRVRLASLPASADLIYDRDGFIYVMDENGDRATQITLERPREWEHAALSFDHQFIVGNDHPQNAPGRSLLWLFDLKNGTEAQLVPNVYFAGDGGVDWDPKGFIYFKCKQKKEIRFSDICKVKYDGTSFQQLTNTPNVEETDVAVSDDGTLVTYALFVPEPEKNSAHTEIWLMNSNGSNQHVVYKAGTVFKASAHDPEISPDNKKLIFSMVNSEVPPNFPNHPAANTAHDIWTITVDGTDLTRLTKPGPISIIPDWKGDSVVFTDLSESYKGASLVNAHDTEQTPKRIREGATSPRWIP